MDTQDGQGQDKTSYCKVYDHMKKV